MCCVCKKCCCGVELASGVATFAYFDIILHLIFLPVPGRLMEIFPLAQYAIAWIFIRCKDCSVEQRRKMYRVTHHVVPNLPLTSKRNFCLDVNERF